jgi:hypothetical protein
MHLSIDDSTKGSIYLSIGKNIYSSQNYGTDFKIHFKNKSSLTGLYLTPGTDTMYISDHYGLYQVMQDTIITLLNTRPKNLKRFYPLNDGNKWIYYISGFDDYEFNSYSYYQTQEIIGDTLMPDMFLYKKIKLEYSNNEYQLYFFARYDSASASINYYEKNSLDNLDLNFLTIPGDTVEKFEDNYSFSILLREDNSTIFDQIKTEKLFQTSSLLGQYYSIVEDIGLNFLEISYDFGHEKKELKGAVINGIVYGDTTITTISEKQEIPEVFQLYQNYPNPFNSETIIHYTLPETDFVTFKIYGVQGRLVLVLLNERRTAGEHKIRFDAKNLSSGIYYYRIETSTYSNTKKMILLR